MVSLSTAFVLMVTHFLFILGIKKHKKIMNTFKCSPLHARVLGLVSQLPDRYYTLGMDNLYNSAKLCRLCYSMEQKVMVHGVTRPT